MRNARLSKILCHAAVLFSLGIVLLVALTTSK